MPYEVRFDIPALTSIRFFAAILVFQFHYGASFASQHLQGGLIADAARQFMTSGYLGVSLFFVLSGFILTISHQHDSMSGRQLSRFYLARFARIYPVYFFALILAWPVLSRQVENAQIVSVLSLTQAWTRPSDGSAYAWITQAWTLSIELAFYLAFPFVLIVIRRMSTNKLVLYALLCVVAIVGLGAPSISPATPFVPLLGPDPSVPLPFVRLPEFLFGMALGLLHLREPGRYAFLATDWALLFLMVGMFGAMACVDQVQLKALFAVFVGLFILGLAQGQGRVSALLSKTWLVFLGGASYAIYILQEPVRFWTMLVLPHPVDRFLNLPILVVVASLVFVAIEKPARRYIMAIAAKQR